MHGVWVVQSFALARSFGRRKRKVMLCRGEVGKRSGVQVEAARLVGDLSE